MAENDRRRTLILNFVAAAGIVICGVLIGGTARMFLFPPEEDSGDNGVSEVVTPEGQTMTALAYQPEKEADRKQAVEALKAYQIESVWHAGKIMVKPADADLALDCLSALGMVPGTEHFSLVDVKADPKTQPRRFEFQQRLAIQNMLVKMLPMISASIADGKVQYLPKGKDGSAVRVTLKLKPGTTLSARTQAEIIHNVVELSPGVNADAVILVDENGKVFR